MLPVTTLQETAWFNLLKEIVSQISAYQFGICHTSKVILPHVLENTSLVLVSPPLHNALCRDRNFECNYICKFSGMYVSWQGAYPH